MAKSTGPILAVGVISEVNHWLLNNQGFDWKIPLATGIAAVVLAGAERVSEPVAVGIAWIALITLTLTRVGGKPSPADNLVKYTGL